MKLFFVTCLVTTPSLFGLSAIGAECSEAFLNSLSYHRGSELLEWNKYPDLPNWAKVSLLGEGGFGTVYRVETGKDESFNLKFYKNLELGLTSADKRESLLNYDIDALEKLEELPERSAKPYPPWFRIVKFKLGKSLTFSYPCDSNCAECNGPKSTDCIECLTPKNLSNGECVSICP